MVILGSRIIEYIFVFTTQLLKIKFVISIILLLYESILYYVICIQSD